MIPRVQSSAAPRAISADPLAPQRAAANAGADIANSLNAVGGELSRRGNRIEQDEIRQSGFTANIERTRRDREFEAAHDQFSQQIPETGEGYATAYINAYDEQHNLAIQRAGSDQRAITSLNETYQVEREAQLANAERREREWRDEYRTHQYTQEYDNSLQRVARQTNAGSPQHGDGGFRQRLGHTESGNRHNIRNSEGFVGRYQFGQARLDDFSRQNGVGEIDLDEFQKNPELQERVMDWHIQDIDNFILDNGLDRSIGRRINGTAVTLDGMRAVAHLGGRGGLKKFIESNGSHNPSDSNGTSLHDYLTTHGSDEFGVPQYQGELPNFLKDEAFQDELAAINGIIDSMPGTRLERAQLKREALAGLSGAALEGIIEQNPQGALALLRTDILDDALGFNQSRSARNAAMTRAARIAQGQEATLRADAQQIAADQMAFQNGGRIGEAPPELTPDQFGMLTPAQQRNVRQSHIVGDAMSLAGVIDLSQSEALLEELRPSGEGFAGEQEAFIAAQRVIESRREQAAVVADQARALETGAAVNLNLPGASESLDARWQQRSQEAQQNNQDFIQTAQGFVEDFGVIPEAVTDGLTRALSSDEPNEIASAASLISSIANEDPESLQGVPQDVRDLAFGVTSRMQRGFSATDARADARQALTNKGSRREIIDRVGGDVDQIVDYVSNAIDDQWFGKPNLSEPEMSSLIETFEDAIVRTQDLETAKIAARADWNENFSPSTLMGQSQDVTWSRFSPESEYAVWGDAELDSSWIRGQLEADVGGRAENPYLRPRPRVFGEPQTYDVFGVVNGAVVNLSLEEGAWVPDVDAEREVFSQDQMIQDLERRSRSVDAQIREGERYISRQNVFRENNGALADSDDLFNQNVQRLEALKAEREEMMGRIEESQEALQGIRPPAPVSAEDAVPDVF